MTAKSFAAITCNRRLRLLDQGLAQKSVVDVQRGPCAPESWRHHDGVWARAPDLRSAVVPAEMPFVRVSSSRYDGSGARFPIHQSEWPDLGAAWLIESNAKAIGGRPGWGSTILCRCGTQPRRHMFTFVEQSQIPQARNTQKCGWWGQANLGENLFIRKGSCRRGLQQASVQSHVGAVEIVLVDLVHKRPWFHPKEDLARH